MVKQLQKSVNVIQEELSADKPCANNIAEHASKLKYLAELLPAKYDNTPQAISHEEVDNLKMRL